MVTVVIRCVSAIKECIYALYHTTRQGKRKKKWREQTPAIRLCCCIQHIFNENAIAGGGVIHKDMSNGTNQFSVLYNR